MQPFGLVTNWQKSAPTQQTPLRYSRSASAPSRDGNTSDEGTPAFQFGGIPSDDEETERAALTLDAKVGNTRHRVSFLKRTVTCMFNNNLY